MRPNNPDGHQELPRRKPYSFVQLPETALERGAPIGHDRYSKARRTGRVEGVLKVLSPLHVASGMIETQTGRYPLVKAHFRSAGRPTIPGSSLKGAIRSIVEAISNPPSCIRVTRARTYNVPKNLSPCSQKEMLCIACRMFGANGYEGQVLFRDARLIDGETEILAIPPLFAPRSQEWAYYDGNTVKGR